MLLTLYMGSRLTTRPNQKSQICPFHSLFPGALVLSAAFILEGLVRPHRPGSPGPSHGIDIRNKVNSVG